jgi:hypothetical protein
MTIKFHPVRLLGALCVFLMFTGCSTFKRDWAAAVERPRPATEIDGPWDGTWQSAVNRHHGRLQCLMSKNGEGEYQARFRATFAKVFHSSYTVPLAAVRTNDLFLLKGRANLGSLAGGEYFYDGHASPTNFFANYQSKYDHGTFELARPK